MKLKDYLKLTKIKKIEQPKTTKNKRSEESGKTSGKTYQLLKYYSGMDRKE